MPLHYLILNYKIDIIYYYHFFLHLTLIFHTNIFLFIFKTRFKFHNLLFFLSTVNHINVGI